MKKSVQVSLLIPAKNSGHALENTVTQAHRFLSQRYPENFEIIVIPNSSGESSTDRTLEIAQNLKTRFSEVVVQPRMESSGKGAALKTGFEVSRGEWVFFTDADLPYDLDFFDQAAQKLQSGYDLITGNRRLPQSHFHVPVSLLPIAYGRHRLGLAFNRLMRWFLPIPTTDTQAGIKALSRRLAEKAFALQSCPGFFFDLEIFLTAIGHGYAHIQLPVTLHLNSEKSTVRILQDGISAISWLIRITWKNKRGGYGKLLKDKRGVLSLYQNLPLPTRFFLWARWFLTPYHVMASYMPEAGKILDLGCGHGLLSLTLARGSQARTVYGLDHDETRVKNASEAAHSLKNIRFEKATLQSAPKGPYSGIAMIDVMHYFRPETQKELVEQAYQLLDSDGLLLVREVDPKAGLISTWNRWYEHLATRIGFTQAEKAGLHFRSKRGWQEMLESVGFEVSSERCSSWMFADILYICQRRPG